jgi:type VI secretion system protein ImpJ
VDPSVSFILAAKAEMPAENLRRDFPPQVTVGAPQQIAQLVKGHLPGVGLFPLQGAPAQIPIHAGFTYFQLDQASAQWKLVVEAKGLALHVPKTFPGLVLTLWAIKG